MKKSIRSYTEYAVASKSLGFFFTFFTFFSTWISGATILGLASMSFKWGLSQYWFIAATYIVGSLSGPIFLSRIRKINVYTVGDFFALRYPEHSKPIRVLVAVSMLCRNVSVIGAQAVTIAFIVSLAFELDFNRTLYITMAVIVAYTALNGLWGIALSDVFQGLFQMIGIPLIIFFITKTAGGFTEIINFYEQINGLSYLYIFSSVNSNTEILLLFLAPGLFFIVEDQTTWQRINSSKNDKVAFWGYLAPIGAALLWLLMPCLIGVFSKAIFPNFTTYPVAFLDFILSLPTPASILILFTMISACVSTCDSYLLASGVIFSRDLVQKVMGLQLSENAQILTTRLGIFLCGILSLYAGTRVYDIFELYLLGAYIGGSVLTVPYLFTWFSKRMNGTGVLWGMLCGIATFVISVLYFDFGYPFSMVFSMVVNAAAGYISCLFSPPPTPEAIAYTYYYSPRFSR